MLRSKAYTDLKRLYFVKELIIKCLRLICCSSIAEGSSLMIEYPQAFLDNYENSLSNHYPVIFFHAFLPVIFSYGELLNKDTIPVFYAVHVGELLMSNSKYPTPSSRHLPLTGLLSVLLSGPFVVNLEETLRCCERLKVGQLLLPPVDLPCSEGPGTDWWQDSSSADRITNVWGCRRSMPSDESLRCTHGILISQEWKCWGCTR